MYFATSKGEGEGEGERLCEVCTCLHVAAPTNHKSAAASPSQERRMPTYCCSLLPRLPAHPPPLLTFSLSRFAAYDEACPPTGKREREGERERERERERDARFQSSLRFSSAYHGNTTKIERHQCYFASEKCHEMKEGPCVGLVNEVITARQQANNHPGNASTRASEHQDEGQRQETRDVL